MHAIELVRFETPDLNGVSRGKTVTADHFWDVVESGLALVSDIFCWDHQCWLATGTGFGEDMTFADLVMRPDLSTFRVLPHVPGQARVICDMEYSDGRPVEASPRRVMQRQVERAAAQGLTALMQAEYEFYLLDAETRLPPFGGTDITTTLTNQRLPALPEIVRHLQALGLRPRTLNQEWGPTQYELTFSPVEGLAGGDDNFTYKTYAKEIAAAARPARELHDEAVHRRERVEQPPAHEPLRRRAQHLLGRGAGRADAGVRVGDRRPARARRRR